MPLWYIAETDTWMDSTEMCIPFENRSFLFGEGIFETILYHEGRLPLYTYHWERMNSAALFFNFHLPSFLHPDNILNCFSTLRKELLSDVRLKIFLIRKSGRGFLPIGTEVNVFFQVEKLENIPSQINNWGFLETIGRPTGKIFSFKSTSSLFWTYAASQASAMGWEDAILCNSEGFISEALFSNVFWEDINGIFHTPSEDCGRINGVFIGFLKEQLNKNGLILVEDKYEPRDLLLAKGIYTCNALRGIRRLMPQNPFFGLQGDPSTNHLAPFLEWVQKELYLRQ